MRRSQGRGFLLRSLAGARLWSVSPVARSRRRPLVRRPVQSGKLFHSPQRPSVRPPVRLLIPPTGTRNSANYPGDSLALMLACKTSPLTSARRVFVSGLGAAKGGGALRLFNACPLVLSERAAGRRTDGRTDGRASGPRGQFGQRATSFMRARSSSGCSSHQ